MYPVSSAADLTRAKDSLQEPILFRGLAQRTGSEPTAARRA